MDNMLIWMLVFAGATIGLLAVFLIASERELRIKRRELETLVNKPSDSTDTDPVSETGFDQHGDIQTIRQLKAENKKLHDDMETLNTSLEVSETRVQELDAKVRGFTNLLTENDQLVKRNEELLEEITALKNQPQGNESREDVEQGQHTGLEDKCAALESELTRLQAELNETQFHLRDMQSTKAQLEAATSRELEITDRYTELERRTAGLTDQLATNQERLMQYDSLQTQLRDVEQRYEQARAETQRLQQEVSAWQERFAGENNSRQRLELIRQHLNEVNTKRAELADKHGVIQQELLAITQIFDDVQQSRSDATPQTATYQSTCSAVTLPLASEAVKPSLEEAKKNLEKGSFEDARQQLEQLLDQAPENREIKLCHLLASLRAYQVEGYEKQIDSIVEMADLTDSERLIARDIFLLRAEDAQKLGRDDEMLRYRAWAKNVVNHIPFGTPELSSPPPSDDFHKDDEHAEARASDTSAAIELSVVAAPDTTNGKDQGESTNGKSRAIVVASVIGLLVFTGAMFSGSFRQRERTTISATVGPNKSGTNSANEPNRDKAALTTSPSEREDESPTKPITPKNENSKLRSFTGARADRTTNNTSTPLAVNKRQSNIPSARENRGKSNEREEIPVSAPRGFGGAYEVVRSTQVLSEPRVGSTLIANIEQGTRVNVVAARDGWFEIRSKYGRPPGFIPREAAVRVQQN